MPWREWLHSLGNPTDGAPTGRNHYDRLVHFAYGLLVLPAAWELIDARMSPRGIWRYLMPVFFVMSHSVIYELIEWVAAEVLEAISASLTSARRAINGMRRKTWRWPPRVPCWHHADGAAYRTAETEMTPGGPG